MLQLELLWKLQCIDREINEIKKDTTNKELHKRLFGLKGTYNSLKESFGGESLRLDQNRKAEARLNVDLKLYEEKLNEIDSRLYEDGQNLKTIENLQKEIVSYKEKEDETETELLELIEKDENISIDMNEMKNQLTECKVEFEKTKELYLKNTEKDKEFLESLNMRRESIVKEIDELFLKQYDDIACKKINPVSVVNSSTCSECGINLNAMLIDLVKKRNSICFCEHCGRILYID